MTEYKYVNVRAETIGDRVISSCPLCNAGTTELDKHILSRHQFREQEGVISFS